MIPHGLVVFAFEGFLEIVPRTRAWEERLRDVEAASVVIRVQQPRGNVVAVAMIHFHRDRVEHVQADQFHLKLVGRVTPCAPLPGDFRRRAERACLKT